MSSTQHIGARKERSNSLAKRKFEIVYFSALLCSYRRAKLSVLHTLQNALNTRDRGKPTSLRRLTFFPVLRHVLEEVFQRETDVRLIKGSCQPGNSLKWRRSLFLVGRYETVPDQTPCFLRWEVSLYNFGTFHVQNLNNGFITFVYVWLN